MKNRKLSFQIIKLLSVLFVLIFALTACSGGLSGASQDTGTVKINFTGTSASRSSHESYDPMPFPPPPDMTAEELAAVVYNIVLTSGGKTLSFEVGNGATYYKATVPAGNWAVDVKAYIRQNGNFLYAKSDGVNTVAVIAGQSSQVSIKMVKGYVYDVGDTGPGGGIIFCCDPGGFINTATGEICYYLEVAKGDTPESIGNYPPCWAAPTSSAGDLDMTGIERGIGTGRNNTNLILSQDPIAPAALSAKNYSDANFPYDWFMPSIEELKILYRWWNKNQNALPLSNGYWSSSQANKFSAYFYNFDTPSGQEMYLKTEPRCKVRPIRAFAQ